jgi:hypothetical protein
VTPTTPPGPPGSRIDASAVREHLLSVHGDVLEAVLACADGVAERWDGDATTDRDQVVGPLERALDRAGVTGRLPNVLADAVGVAGGTLRAEPVAAPPYVAVTSVGPVLRATLPGGRLVVTVRVFAVERGSEGTDGAAGVRYTCGPGTAAEALAVEFRSSR